MLLIFKDSDNLKKRPDECIFVFQAFYITDTRNLLVSLLSGLMIMAVTSSVITELAVNLLVQVAHMGAVLIAVFSKVILQFRD